MVFRRLATDIRNLGKKKIIDMNLELERLERDADSADKVNLVKRYKAFLKSENTRMDENEKWLDNMQISVENAMEGLDPDEIAITALEDKNNNAMSKTFEIFIDLALSVVSMYRIYQLNHSIYSEIHDEILKHGVSQITRWNGVEEFIGSSLIMTMHVVFLVLTIRSIAIV